MSLRVRGSQDEEQIHDGADASERNPTSPGEHKVLRGKYGIWWAIAAWSVLVAVLFLAVAGAWAIADWLYD
jgi:hypothetical protein